MIGKKLVDERNVTQAEAKSILEDREKLSEPLYEQRIALEIIHKFTKISKDQASEMSKRMADEVPRIKEENVVKIIDLMPKDKEDLNVIFSKERIILTDDEIGKILEIVDNYR
ncbi:MAG: DNA-directed RNA polymerase subunit F [Candidatus Methanofastidiosa archaeon]|nr:DNA-directed RNA polymerase subunit F [Candidatus Methanofastidiosa archaeon]